ncbi:hypothetical protein [Pseudomonas syringae]|uniref:hypothetical protein n=1 Tax=Pseudomonas syringae TaxID=317 RepID=UPI000AF4D6C4|nr:hypothetical protein [Pseudomonas syringae]
MPGHKLRQRNTGVKARQTARIVPGCWSVITAHLRVQAFIHDAPIKLETHPDN